MTVTLQDALPGLSRSEDHAAARHIDSERARAQKIIETNLRNLVRPGPFKLVDQARQVFGDAYGVATGLNGQPQLSAPLRQGRQLVHRPALKPDPATV